MSETQQPNEITQEEAERFHTYTLKECEQLLHVSNRTLQSYVKSGKLKAVKIGGRWRVTPAALDRFINGEPPTE